MDHQYLAKNISDCSIDFEVFGQYDNFCGANEAERHFVLLYNQPKRNDFKGYQPPPPVIQHTTYTKHEYQHSKHYVGVESCMKVGDIVAEATYENETI